jgi:putative ATP-dependent endonuclease of OLD family
VQVRQLEIENFRGFREFRWCPGPGLNLVLGAGDSGKTTLLDAIALALSPQPSQAALETDYRNLDTATPFKIRVVLGALSREYHALSYPPALWGWNDAAKELRPAPNDDTGDEAVAHIEVIGTEDLELQHRILQSGNEPRSMSVPVRAAVGLWNVTTNRTPDAQLRMSRGSLLERVLGRDRLRAPAVAAMQGTADTLVLPEDTTIAVDRLGAQLRAAGISFERLTLALVPGVGQSPVQLVSLVAQSGDGHIPLANFGRGSQQMAMVTLAAAQIAGVPIAVVDEIEAGLEPYRQRSLIARLRAMVATEGQAFVTSHSPSVIGRLNEREAWRLHFDGNHTMRRIEGSLHDLLRTDPEALLCKVPLVCEGATETGVVRAFLADSTESDATALGLHLVDAGGHGHALTLITALAEDERPICAIVDEESFGGGTRNALAEKSYVHLCRPPGGRCIECAVANALALSELSAMVELPGTDGQYMRVDSRLQAISHHLGSQSRQSIGDLVLEYGEQAVRQAVGETATRGGWFKSALAGEELGKFIIDHVESNHELVSALRSLVNEALTLIGVEARVAQQ